MDTTNWVLLLLLGLVIGAVLTNIVHFYQVYESTKGFRALSEHTFDRHPLWVKNLTEIHVKCVNIFLLSALVAVILIEVMVKIKYGWGGVIHLLDTPLGQVHAVFDGIFFVSTNAMRWYFTGKRYPRIHRDLFKFVLTSYVGILITGTWLMVRFVS